MRHPSTLIVICLSLILAIFTGCSESVDSNPDENNQTTQNNAHNSSFNSDDNSVSENNNSTSTNNTATNNQDAPDNNSSIPVNNHSENNHSENNHSENNHSENNHAEPTLPGQGWDCDPDLELDVERYNHFLEPYENRNNAEIFDAIVAMISDHISYTYGEARDFMYSEIDIQDDGMLECIYTGRRVAPDGTRTPSGFNTEHTWPQSQGASQEPARSDIHHLFPTDSMANTRRDSHEFGWVSCNGNACDWNNGGSYLGPATDGRDPVFEVREEKRGDIARAKFYFSMRYGYAIETHEEEVLREWHCMDPPDEFERRRNDLIENYQQNRNPFVDRPDFVEFIANF